MLAPLFLLGALAVAVPLLVHLVQKEKREPTAFPSMMFLEKTPAPFTARRNVRDPWLLLLRILAILALVLAFARPVFGPKPILGAVDQRRRDIVVLLDRSFSMRVGTRWDRARAAVDSVIRTLGTQDRLTLVPFDRRAQAITAATGDRAVLRAALDTVTLTDESTRFTPALTIAQQRLATSDAPRRLLVVVSDFQRTAWDLTDDTTLPSGTETAFVDVTDATAPVRDRSVRSIDVREDRRSGTAEAIVTARVANTGEAVRGVGVRLEVGGRVVESRSVDLPADAGTSVTFAGVPLAPAPVPARVVLDADAVARDDAQHVLLQQSTALRVVVVESRVGAFLTRALSIGSAPRFDIVSRTPSSVTPRDLTGTQLLVLADGAFPTGLGVARLSQFVRNGGGLLVALGDQTSPRAWQGDARALLPGGVLPAHDADGAHGATLGDIDARHPALSLLSGDRSGDLTAARFLRYRAIDTTGGVLARFDDGSAALVEHAVGAGRVMVFGSTLDGAWNDLPRQPAFLPLVQQLAQYTSQWRAPTQAVPIGARVRPADMAGTTTRAARWVSTAPSGQRTAVGGADGSGSFEVREAGIHELRPGGEPGARPILLAANIAPAELDFTSFDVTRLAAALTPASAAQRTRTTAAADETPADREARQSTWWYLLGAATLLLAAETLVARRAGSTTPVTE